MLRSTVESVRSRCQRETGSFSARWRSSALARPRLPSEFSKSIGLTLCGIVDDPTSPSLDSLAEIAERDIAPQVAVEIDQDRVDARERIEQLGQTVMRLDLRRVRIEFETERPRRAAPTALPVDIGIGDAMRVVVAHRAIDLALDRHVGERRHRRSRRATTLAISLPSVVGVAGWPCVRASIGTAACACASARSSAIERLERGQQHIAPRRREHQPVREVVDILRRAREMDELAPRARSPARAAKRSFSQYSTALTS